MACCFLTGVQVGLEDSFVLNCRQAHDLLNVLKDRLASLRRVVEQLSPLDEQDGYQDVPAARRAGFAPKKHRLVCKAVADALAPGFPEISLFMPWPAYHLHARQAALQGRRPKKQKQSARAEPPDHETPPKS